MTWQYTNDRNGQGNLGRWEGSRDPAHIARWVAAQNEGKRNAPKCEAVSKNSGERCRMVVRRGSRFCYWHAHGTEADALDHRHEQRMLEWLEGSPWQRQKAEKALARIARRRVYRLWKLDPRGPVIDLLELAPADEKDVADWLWRHHQIRLGENLPGTDRQATARCRDRLRYAAWRVLARGAAASADFIKRAHHRVNAAVRDDAAFWRKFEAIPEFTL